MSLLVATSDAAVNPYPGWGGYGSAKAALEQLSAVLAAENPGWRIYTVDPGDMRSRIKPPHEFLDKEAVPASEVEHARPLDERGEGAGVGAPGLVLGEQLVDRGGAAEGEAGVEPPEAVTSRGRRGAPSGRRGPRR